MRALVLVAVVALACSSASLPDVAASPAARDAQMVTRTRPELRMPDGPPREGVVMDLQVQVQIDSTGRPDMRSLRVTGTGAVENREIIARWIEAAQFRPASKDGRPVASRYRTRFRVETRRVGGD